MQKVLSNIDFAKFSADKIFKKVEDYHGIHAKIYDSIRDDVSREIEFYTSLIEGKKRVLELGCGTGALSIPLSKKCDGYLAIDNSRDMVSIMKSKLLKMNPIRGLELRIGDFNDFSASKDGFFDLVIIPYNSLVHVTDPNSLLSLFGNISKVLTPGGKLVADLWIPRVKRKVPYIRCEIVSQDAEKWLMISEELFTKTNNRIVNLIMLPLNSSRQPVATRITEFVFTRSDVRKLFVATGFKVRIVSHNATIIKDEKDRVIYVGTKT